MIFVKPYMYEFSRPIRLPGIPVMLDPKPDNRGLYLPGPKLPGRNKFDNIDQKINDAKQAQEARERRIEIYREAERKAKARRAESEQKARQKPSDVPAYINDPEVPGGKRRATAEERTAMRKYREDYFSLLAKKKSIEQKIKKLEYGKDTNTTAYRTAIGKYRNEITRINLRMNLMLERYKMVLNGKIEEAQKYNRYSGVMGRDGTTNQVYVKYTGNGYSV